MTSAVDRSTLLRLRRQLIESRWATRLALAEARTDPLTGLGNRRALAETTEAWLLAGAPFALVLFDMANLKAANTALGHEGANALLRRAAAALRAGDELAVRMGGDEFAVLLPGASLEQALAVRDRLEAAFGVLDAGGTAVFLVGDVAAVGPAGLSLEQALQLADFGLERRKAGLKAGLGAPPAVR